MDLAFFISGNNDLNWVTAVSLANVFKARYATSFANHLNSRSCLTGYSGKLLPSYLVGSLVRVKTILKTVSYTHLGASEDG